MVSGATPFYHGWNSGSFGYKKLDPFTTSHYLCCFGHQHVEIKRDIPLSFFTYMKQLRRKMKAYKIRFWNSIPGQLASNLEGEIHLNEKYMGFMLMQSYFYTTNLTKRLRYSSNVYTRLQSNWKKNPKLSPGEIWLAKKNTNLHNGWKG